MDSCCSENATVEINRADEKAKYQEEEDKEFLNLNSRRTEH